jgi:ABC-type glycerol-3-phosphate transport system substrate-binding protein
VALLVTSVPPNIGPDGIRIDACPVLDQAEVSDLPGSRTLYGKADARPAALKNANRPAHLGTTGWMLALGTSPRPEAIDLLKFLLDRNGSVYLVQGAPRGLLPTRRQMLNEPDRFRRNGLPPTLTDRLFQIVREGLAQGNRVADPRVSVSEPLIGALGARLEEAREGKRSPKEALEAAAADWERVIKPARRTVIDEYRVSLGLPPLPSDD